MQTQRSPILSFHRRFTARWRVSPAARMLRRAMALWAASSLSKKLLGILAVLLAFYIPYQISFFQAAAAQQAAAPTRVAIDNQGTQLHIVSPQRLRLAREANEVQPLSFWLEPAPGGQPPTYTLTLSPAGPALVFTNEEGAPATPRLLLSSESATPATIYLRRNSAVPGGETTLHLILTPAPVVPPAPLTISLERRFSAAIRHLAVATAENVVSLPVAIAAVGLLIWRQWQEEERLQRERMASLRAALEETTRLATLASNDPVQAAAQWHKLHAEDQPGAIWTHEEVRYALAGVRLAITSSERWQERLLQAATSAESLRTAAGQIVALDSDLHSLPGVAARYLHGEAIWQCADVTAEHSFQALLWLFQHCQESAGPLVTETVAQLATWNLSPAWRVLVEDAHGRRLLRLAPIEETLETRREQEASTLCSEEKHTIEQILAVCQVAHRWPRSWNPVRPAEAVQLDNALSRLGLARNPFGPLLAELDPHLPEFHSKLAQEVMGLDRQTPVLCFGKPGAGKTAQALCLVDRCANPPPSPNIAQTFPVFHQITQAGLARYSSLQRLLAMLGEQIGAALIRFLARNPDAFLDQKLDNQAAIAVACLCSAGGRGNLLLRLRQGGLAGDVTGQLFRATLDHSLLDEAAAVRRQSDWIETLGKARPHGFVCTYLLIDVHGQEVAAPDADRFVRSLNHLLQLMAPLAAGDVYIKLFLPEGLRPLIAETMPPGVVSGSLCWGEADLEEMLKARLRWASDGRIWDFSQLFNPRMIDPNAQPAQLLAAAAKGSPRRLVELGNRLLYQHARQDAAGDHLSFAELESLVHDSH